MELLPLGPESGRHPKYREGWNEALAAVACEHESTCHDGVWTCAHCPAIEPAVVNYDVGTADLRWMNRLLTE